MSWTRYLLSDFWAARELDEMERRLSRTQRARTRAGRATSARISELEDDIARLTLVVKALSDAIVAKGAMTRDDLSTWLERIDLLDGVSDGRLDSDAPDAPSAEDGTPEDDGPTAPVPGRRRRR